MAIEFGDDFSSFRENGTYGLTYRRITGRRVPLEGVARRWLNAPGDMPWDPVGGIDLAELENHDLSAAELARLGQILGAEARRVDFVIDSAVSVRLISGDLKVDGQILLADQTAHPLLLTANQAGVFFSIP